MSRFLCVAPPYAGHVFPLASIGAELAARGHEVAWVSYAAAQRFLPAGGTFFAIADDAVLQRSDELALHPPPRFLAAQFVVFYRDVVLPMADAMLPQLDAVVARFRPDAILADQHALAGGLAARRHGLPWVTSSASSMLHAHALEQHAPTQRWLAEVMHDLQQRAGLAPVAAPDLSPRLVLLYSSAALAGGRPVPAQCRFVGPALAHRRADAETAIALSARRPRVLVSLGSVLPQSGTRFFATVAAALGGEDAEVIVGAPEGALQPAPANFIVRRWLPQIDLLPQVDAVVTAGGSLAFEALAFGVPLVLAPVWTDQFATAGQIAAAGAGIRVRYARVTAEELRAAVRRALHEPALRKAAAAAQASLRAAGGTRAAADLCAAVVGEPAPRSR